MGRVGSIYALSEAALIIIATLCFGIGAQLKSIQFVVILGAVIMFLFSIILCIFLFQPKRAGTHETYI
ncbi:MFS transporter, partial [Bacillus atrophaeus]|nr:MFS transporter [Bacillus atrophaeus]